MDKLIKLNELDIIQELTTEELLNIQPLVRTEYSDNELKAIKQELYLFLKFRNEKIDIDVLDLWIDEFSKMQMTPTEILKRVRLAKMKEKYGVTDFSIFMNVDIKNYTVFYKHKRIEE